MGGQHRPYTRQFREQAVQLVTQQGQEPTRVARELDRLTIDRGKPAMVASDNGSELTSNAILAWADRPRVEWHYVAPGKPM